MCLYFSASHFTMLLARQRKQRSIGCNIGHDTNLLASLMLTQTHRHTQTQVKGSVVVAVADEADAAGRGRGRSGRRPARRRRELGGGRYGGRGPDLAGEGAGDAGGDAVAMETQLHQGPLYR